MVNITNFKKDESEYAKQAADFCKRTGCNISAEYSGQAVPQWDGEKHNHFKIKIERGRRSFIVDFYDSIANTEKYKPEANGFFPLRGYPSAYDIISCLQKYDCGTFEDFCAEFGYNEDSRKDEQIYNACKKEFENLQRLFSDEEIEQLQEIN